MNKDLLIWGGGALLAYILYSSYVSSNAQILSPTGVASYLPTANSAGNEFSCPTGTIYVDYDSSSASGGGYCE